MTILLLCFTIKLRLPFVSFGITELTMPLHTWPTSTFPVCTVYHSLPFTPARFREKRIKGGRQEVKLNFHIREPEWKKRIQRGENDREKTERKRVREM